MVLVVEDGSGNSSADSYISVADADVYFSARNNATWAGMSDAEKEAGLLYATAYIDANYEWPGFVENTTQALDWPRSDAYDTDDRELSGIPRQLKNATCELALAHNTDSLATTFDRGGRVKREKVGPLEVEYESGAPAGATYPLVDSLLGSITSTGPGVVQLIRG